jgi:hypothetical protein
MELEEKAHTEQLRHELLRERELVGTYLQIGATDRLGSVRRFSIAAVTDCFVFAMSVHGSRLSVLRRAGRFSIVK